MASPPSSPVPGAGEFERWLCKHLKFSPLQCILLMLVVENGVMTIHKCHQALVKRIKGENGKGENGKKLVSALTGRPPEELFPKETRAPSYASTHSWLKNFESIGLVSIEKKTARKRRAIPYVRMVSATEGVKRLSADVRAGRISTCPDTICCAVVVERTMRKVFLAPSPDHPVSEMRRKYQLPWEWWTRGEKKPRFPFEAQAAEAAVRRMSNKSITWRAYNEVIPKRAIQKRVWPNGKVIVPRVFTGITEKASLRKLGLGFGRWFTRKEIKKNRGIDQESRKLLLGLWKEIART